jgi:hypothetical protein
MRAVVVLIAALLAVAVVWAGTALGGGSSGDAKPRSTPAKSETGKRQAPKRAKGKDCPFKQTTHDSSV